MDIEKQWFEDDTFWETWGPWLFSQPRMEHAAKELDGMLGLLQLAPGAHILDLGCGVGRHSVELARRGFKVTGVDRTTSYLKQARERAVKENLEIEFIHSDMRAFMRPEAFETVINMFTTFGYFEDINDDRKVVKNMYDSLKPGGVFIIDTHGKETLAKIFQKHNWEEHEGVFVLQDHMVSQNWSWMKNRWIMFRDGERIEHTVSHRLYAGSEMAALLNEGGFSRVDVYGGSDGRPYDENAQRLVAVGHK
jgi:SAM-dependent methyltransferase